MRPGPAPPFHIETGRYLRVDVNGPTAARLGLSGRDLLRLLRLASRAVLGPGRSYVPNTAREDAPRAKRLRARLARHGASIGSWTRVYGNLVLVLKVAGAPDLVVTSSAAGDVAARWSCMLAALAELEPDGPDALLAVASLMLSTSVVWTMRGPQPVV